MAPGPEKRARSSTSGSTTSIRPRPVSRASTTSINTSSAQTVQQYRHASESSNIPPIQSAHCLSIQYTPEEMITRSEQQLTNPSREYTIDPILQEHVVGPRAMSVDHVYNGVHNGMRPLRNHDQSFESQERHFVMGFNDEQTQDDAGLGETRKKKGSASSIANDQELRRLFRENHHRDLNDVAASVLANERGPRSEKTKQIFAMNWLNSVCTKSNSSVPRNRVYSHYATRCGTERVPPLNPASFGKLVRIIFPGIQTRRLGMRGESKYHYVDLALIDEQPETNTGGQIEDGDVGTTGVSVAGGSHRSELPADTAVFPSPSIPLNHASSHNRMQNKKASGCLYLDPASTDIHRGPSGSNMVSRALKFPSYQEPPYTHDECIELPSLQRYLPTGTDVDAADALIALYRAHCISVIDNFRYCREKSFWHNFTSFQGTLTSPVIKLLDHPDIAAWVKECDWLMYQKMVRFVSPLALQVMPPRVIESFRSISNKLSAHISTTFQNHPQHVRDARLGPATIFAGLIDRLLRVNATAHAAANMLTNDANRDQMWHDWVYYVRPINVVESTLPECGYTRTLQILTTEIRELLGPLRATSYPGMQAIYATALSSTGPDFTQKVHSELDDSSTSGVLDRWTTFLHEFSSRFPGADARALLHCVGEVGSAALRDITMAQALSFGSWWVTKVWVDEMLRWIAEKGGFLEHSPSSMKMRPRKRSADEAELGIDDITETYEGSRPRTGVSSSNEAPIYYRTIDTRSAFESHSDEGPLGPHLQKNEYRQPGPAQMNGSRRPHLNGTIPEHIQKETEYQHVQSHDDSGIGLDIELPPHHEPVRMADYGGFVAGINGSSDPADVVVC